MGSAAACAFRGTGRTCEAWQGGQVLDGPRHAGRDSRRMESPARSRRRGIDRRAGPHRLNRLALLATARRGRLTLPGARGGCDWRSSADTARQTARAGRCRSAKTECLRKIGRQQANRQQCANPSPHNGYPQKVSMKYTAGRGRGPTWGRSMTVHGTTIARIASEGGTMGDRFVSAPRLRFGLASALGAHNGYAELRQGKGLHAWHGAAPAGDLARRETPRRSAISRLKRQRSP